MDIKQIQSKINLITAQKKQLSESGFFTAEEIERYSKFYDTALEPLEKQIQYLTDGHNLNVESPEFV